MFWQNNSKSRKNQIYKDGFDYKGNKYLKFRFRYIQDLINTIIDRAKSKYYENLVSKLSGKIVSPEK